MIKLYLPLAVLFLSGHPEYTFAQSEVVSGQERLAQLAEVLKDNQSPKDTAVPTVAPTEVPVAPKPTPEKVTEKKTDGLTRVRALGDPEWRMSKRRGGSLEVKVRNVGDYTAKAVAVSVTVNGKVFQLKGGDSELAPNGTTTFTYSGMDLVVLGGRYPTSVTCSNCHR